LTYVNIVFVIEYIVDYWNKVNWGNIDTGVTLTHLSLETLVKKWLAETECVFLQMQLSPISHQTTNRHNPFSVLCILDECFKVATILFSD
jgi:hypothetical protein